MWLFYFLGFALVIGFYNGMVDADDANIRAKRRVSYADSMRNLMANSRASVNRPKWTWSTTQETVPSDVNSEELFDAEDANIRAKRRVSYADSMRNLMANSRASVNRPKWTWSTTQETVPSDVNSEELFDAEDANIRAKRRVSYADSMRNLMANSRASVNRPKWTWSTTQETVPSDVNSEEVFDAEDANIRAKRRVSYADSMRNLMANSRASVNRPKWTWSTTQETVPSEVNSEEVFDAKDVNIRAKRRLSYADSMRNLMANSRASVTRQKFTWSPAQETVPSEVNSAEYVRDGEDSEDNN